MQPAEDEGSFLANTLNFPPVADSRGFGCSESSQRCISNLLLWVWIEEKVEAFCELQAVGHDRYQKVSAL